MTTALEILAKLQKINVTEAAQVSIRETNIEAVNAQQQQLAQGLKADGTYQDDYSARSVREFGKPPGPIKLFDQGGFYKGLKIEVVGDKFNINSTDEKNDYLDIKYRPLGLGTAAKIEWLKTLRPVFVSKIKLYLK